jgi:hypothetical protein
MRKGMMSACISGGALSAIVLVEMFYRMLDQISQRSFDIDLVRHYGNPIDNYGIALLPLDARAPMRLST